MIKAKLILLATLLAILMAGNCPALETIANIHGFLSQGAVTTTENNFFGATEDRVSTDFRELGINMSGGFFDDRLNLGFQIVARDFGDNGNNKVRLDWAVADLSYKNWLNFRGGRIKVAKGLYNETRDVDMLRTNIFLPQSVYPEILRGVDLSIDGVGVYGYVDLSSMGGVSYQFAYGTQDPDPNSDTAMALQGVPEAWTDVINDFIDVKVKITGGMVYYPPIDGLRISGTYDNSKIQSIGTITWDNSYIETFDIYKYQNIVGSVEYTIGDLVLAAEYIQTHRQYDEDWGFTFNGYFDRTSDGFYVSGTYQVNDWLSVGTYYAESYCDKDDREGEEFDHRYAPATRAHFKDLCLGVAFTPWENWSIKLEGHQLKGSYLMGTFANQDDEDQYGQMFMENEWFLFAAKLTFSF